jgi:AcrR family transcriptional regulator
MATNDGAVARTARERARAEIMAEIVATGNEHLARDGAPGLSLRAVARDLGMVSSAIYRYVPNRDALLTLLIIDAYDSIGAAAEKAESAVSRKEYLTRFLAVCHAVRAWALAHPHEYALIYGSPVPGYAAPQDTIGPASRVPTVLLTILVDQAMAGALPKAPKPDPAVVASIAPARDFLPPVIPEGTTIRGFTAYSSMFGAISFELFGQWQKVVANGQRARKAFFDQQMRILAEGLIT